MAALFTGLGLMTKFNGVLVIVILSLIYMIRFFRDKEKRRKYIYQLLTYLLIMLPIGGWYYGCAYYKYKTPINYVQGWKDPHSDIGSRHTVYERFTHDEWGSFYVDLQEDQNWNMWALGIKSSLFDEHNYQYNNILHVIAPFLFYTSTFFFSLTCFCSLWYLLCRPVHSMKALDLILISYVLLLLSSFIYFNYCFPHPYTANFRYMPIFFVCAICLWERFLKDKAILFYLLPLAIAMSSFLFYSTLIYQDLF